MFGLENFEAIVTSDGTGEPWNTCVWDSTTGTVLATYKSNSTASCHRGIAFIGDSYIIAAQKDKPIILVWALNKKEQVHMRMLCPAKPSALAVSHSGTFCIASFEEKFHIWQISDGKLLIVVSSHLQTITCIKFNDSDSHFVTGAADGQVSVWSLAKTISTDTDQNSKPEPLYTWNDHQLQVTDIHIGSFRDNSRIVTVSLDQTCKVYKLSSGQLLLSFVLDVALTSVVMDPSEFNLYIGAVNGRIYKINLFNITADKDIHLTDKEKEESIFTGHAKQVTSLAVNFDASNLLSGSYDNTARIWHIPSKQCIHTLNHKGPVLNVFFIPTPYYIKSSDKFRPSHIINQFQRQMIGQHSSEEVLSKTQLHTIKSFDFKNKDVISLLEAREIVHELGNKIDCEPGDSKVNLRQELQKQGEINQQLYDYAVGSVLQALNMSDDL